MNQTTQPTGMLDQQELKKRLVYDKETGIFTRTTSGHGCRKGEIVHHVETNGYVVTSILRKRYYCHRLAWLYVYGTWPAKQIDHINGVKTDNRICNLREVTCAENQQNKIKPPSTNSSGLIGATYNKSLKRWLVRIEVNGKKKYIGRFLVKEDAHNAYMEAKKKFHPGYASRLLLEEASK